MFAQVSSIAEKVDNAFLYILVISVSLLALITFLMIYFVIKYSHKKNKEAEDIEGNKALEIVWTIIPTALVMSMFYYGWTGFKIMRGVPGDALKINVSGQMWFWRFSYDNGIESDLLRVPKGKPIVLELTSRDVIHSLYIPALRIKEDAVAGMKTHLWFKADKEGEYDILCAEYCGQRHSYMLSKLIVLSEDRFNAWYEQASQEGKTAESKSKVSKKDEGLELLKIKGCLTCHTINGSPLVGPTFKGMYGKKETVITAGKERTIIINDEYIKKSLLEPNADIVKGFQPIMPPQKDLLKEKDISQIIEYLKKLK